MRRIGQQRHGYDGAEEDGRQDGPEGGPAQPGQMPDSALGISRPEGQRRRAEDGMSHRQRQQRSGIIRPDVGPQRPDDGLVTADLHIPSGQKKGNPDQGIEPVEAQCPVGQQLEEMIQPPDVEPLVEQDVFALPGLQGRGEIDPGSEQAQHKGRGNAVRQVDPADQGRGGPQLPPQPSETGQGPEDHGRGPGQPDPGQHVFQGERLCLRCRIRKDRSLGKLRGDQGGTLDGLRHIFNAADQRAGLPGRGVQQRKERRRRRQRHRTQQPEQHHGPKGIGNGPGRFPEEQPQRQHRRNDNAGRQAHIEQGGKQGLQHQAHLRMPSMMALSSSISRSESRFRELKAARKAGSDPSKVSSTNCSLCMA